MKKRFVLLFGKKMVLEFGQYPNDTIGITVNHRNQPYMTATINWETNWLGSSSYTKTFQLPYVVLKNYDENEGIVQMLQDAGVVEKGGAYMAGTRGTVEVRKLTEEWAEIAKKQLQGLEVSA